MATNFSRPPWQFSIRTLLLATVVAGIFFALVAMAWQIERLTAQLRSRERAASDCLYRCLIFDDVVGKRLDDYPAIASLCSATAEDLRKARAELPCRIVAPSLGRFVADAGLTSWNDGTDWILKLENLEVGCEVYAFPLTMQTGNAGEGVWTRYGFVVYVKEGTIRALLELGSEACN
jgi:hypothetical protein